MYKIFVVGGGTGGHIIPARCVAKFFYQQKHRVYFFGDEKILSYVKADDGFKSAVIKVSQVQKSVPLLIKSCLKICVGILQSLYFILREKPEYIFAFGGYASFPMLIAAVITRRKIILHEQNAHLGKVNRIFARFAHKIALSFSETSGILAKFNRKTIFTGNPVRQEILELNKLDYKVFEREVGDKKNLSEDLNKMGYDLLLASDFSEKKEQNESFKILVIGGSGGAKIFTEILPKAFFNLSDEIKGSIQISQQCRKDLVQETFSQYQAFNISVTIDSFFDNMSDLIRDAHLVIARSGASSIFEFCAAKKPMILVPFALAADDHQQKNAEYVEKNGGAIIIQEREFTIKNTSQILNNLIKNPEILKKMSDNAGNIAILDASQKIASIIKSDF